MCYQWERYGTSAANLINICHLYWGSVKPNFHTGPGDRFLWDMISKNYWQFWQFLQKYTWKQYSCIPIEVMWRKMVCSVRVKPMSVATWRLHTLWCFTVPANSLPALYRFLKIILVLGIWSCYITRRPSFGTYTICHAGLKLLTQFW